LTIQERGEKLAGVITIRRRGEMKGMEGRLVEGSRGR